VTPANRNAKTIEDAQGVFDALDQYLATSQWTNANSSASLDGSGTTHTMNCSDRQGNSFTYTERVVGVRITIQPNYVSLNPGQTQQFTATVTNADGTPATDQTVVWSLQAGAVGKIGLGGFYAAPSTSAGIANDTVTATSASGDSWSSASVQITQPSGQMAQPPSGA
jgi:hypothetical protein